MAGLMPGIASSPWYRIGMIHGAYDRVRPARLRQGFHPAYAHSWMYRRGFANAWLAASGAGAGAQCEPAPAPSPWYRIGMIHGAYDRVRPARLRQGFHPAYAHSWMYRRGFANAWLAASGAGPADGARWVACSSPQPKHWPGAPISGKRSETFPHRASAGGRTAGPAARGPGRARPGRASGIRRHEP